MVQITQCLAEEGSSWQTVGRSELRFRGIQIGFEPSLLCSETSPDALDAERGSLPHLEGNRLQVQLTDLREADSLTLMLSESGARAAGTDRFTVSRTRRGSPCPSPGERFIMPTQLCERSPGQIPRSGKPGFPSGDTASLLPDQPGSLGLGSNRRNPADVRRLESHGSVPLASPGHTLSSLGGKCHFLTSACKTGWCAREAVGPGSGRLSTCAQEVQGALACVGEKHRLPGWGGGRGRGQIGADSYSSKDKDLFCVRRTSLCSDTFVRTPALALLGVHCSPIFLTRKQRPGEVRKQTQGPLPVSDQAKV